MKPLTSGLCIFLIISGLILPNPVLALRTEAPKETGLEEPLRASLNPAGAEEKTVLVASALKEGQLQGKVDEIITDPLLAGVPATNLFRIGLILHEELANINYHGFRFEPGHLTQISFHLDKDPEQVVIKIRNNAPSPQFSHFKEERPKTAEEMADQSVVHQASTQGKHGGLGVSGIIHGFREKGSLFLDEEFPDEGGNLYTFTFPLGIELRKAEPLGELPETQSPIAEMIPIYVHQGGRVASGRAIRFDPCRVLLRQPVNPAVTSGTWEAGKIRQLPPDQQPGLPLAKLAKKPHVWGRLRLPKGSLRLLAMNNLQTNFWETHGFLITRGKLVAIPGVKWNSPPWVLGLDPSHLGLKQLPLDSDGRPSTLGIQEAIAGPVLVRDGRDVSGEVTQYPPQAPDPNEVIWSDPQKKTAAFSAIGRTEDNRLIAFALTGEPEKGVPQASLKDVAMVGRALGAVDLILLGGSMDVQQQILGEETPGILGKHNNPPHPSGRHLNAALMGFLPPASAAGLEEIRRLDTETFALLHPGQAHLIPKAAAGLLIVPENALITLYRPDSLTADVDHLIVTQKKELPVRLRIRPAEVPTNPLRILTPAFLIWDRMRGEPPYTPPVPWVNHWNGQPFEKDLLQMIAEALSGEPARFLAAWGFEKDGRAYLVLAVAA